MDIDSRTPVVVMPCRLTALSVMRSLGRLGVPVWGVGEARWDSALTSRFCQKKIVQDLDENNPEEFLRCLMRLGSQSKQKMLLIPTVDEWSMFISDHAEELEKHFIFQRNSRELVHSLASKKEMFALALKHGIPTPQTIFPKNLEDVKDFSKVCTYPLLLKGIHVNRLHTRTGIKMLAVSSPKELIDKYLLLEDPDQPNLMIQEYIPGGDDQIYIFNGYFNADSQCLAAFTGHKIRQFPVHFGAASLGICKENRDVREMTIRFMGELGYQGILDIGYRLDPRDNQYKVLDINPRIGQAFRLFVAHNNMDVAKAIYLDLTGQKLPPIEPREGRRWLIENQDLVSTYNYYREGTLGFREWLQSLKKVEETAWFDGKDPLPFLIMVLRNIFNFLKFPRKKLKTTQRNFTEPAKP
ncbi:MAG: hypothetical protein KAU27_01550 [Desulfuromonadales bacterium]|nr:hypothetical protein [Desulfuromonadales bacterium]